MVKTAKFWKATGIYLIILNFVLLVIFSGFVLDKKIGDRYDTNHMFELEYSKFNNYDLNSEEIVLGDEVAPLTIIVYNDYESPYCKKFNNGVYEKLKKEYVDSGKVNVIVKDFPLANVHKNSLIAAQAVKCAGEQEMAEEMHDMILDNKYPTEDNLKIWAKNLSLDNGSFCECLDSKKYLDEIIINTEEAKENEIKVVPTFFIGDEKVEGVQPYFVMKKIIDKELAKLNH